MNFIKPFQDMAYDEETVPHGGSGRKEGLSTQPQETLRKSLLRSEERHSQTGRRTGTQQHQHHQKIHNDQCQRAHKADGKTGTGDVMAA